MKFFSILVVTVLFFLVPKATHAAIRTELLNESTSKAYCEVQGYTYKSTDKSNGECIFDDGKKCDAKNFAGEYMIPNESLCGEEKQKPLQCVKNGDYVRVFETCCTGKKYSSPYGGNNKCGNFIARYKNMLYWYRFYSQTLILHTIILLSIFAFIVFVIVKIFKRH